MGPKGNDGAAGLRGDAGPPGQAGIHLRVCMCMFTHVLTAASSLEPGVICAYALYGLVRGNAHCDVSRIISTHAFCMVHTKFMCVYIHIHMSQPPEFTSAVTRMYLT